MDQLLSIERKVECLREEVGKIKEQLRLFLDLAAPSLAVAMKQAREILEFLVGRIMKAEGLKVEENLMNNIEILGAYDTRDEQSRKAAARRRRSPNEPTPPPILPRHIYSSLHNLRMYGNLVTHPWDPETMELKDVRVTSTDLQVALGQIMRLIEWYFQEYPRGPRLDPLYAGVPQKVLGEFGDALPDTAGFLGRAAEVAELARLLGEGRARLVTVLAPAGQGKTLLAAKAVLAAAAHGQAGDGSIIWLDLKEAPSFADVTARILACLQPNARPTNVEIVQQSAAARVALIVRRMADRPVFLVLDNFESWLDPTTRQPTDPHVTRMLTQIGTRAHRGCALFTSRVEADIPGVPFAARERLVLGPLPPDDAGRLLLSQGIQGSDRAVRRVTQQLGGNPRLLLLLADLLRRRGRRDLDAALAASPHLLDGEAGKLLAEVWQELPGEARWVLQALAILRPPARPQDIQGVLANVSECPPVQAEGELWETLLPRALVTHTPDGEAFAVEHLLIRDYALRQWEDVAAAHRAAMSYFGRLAEAPEAASDYEPHLAMIRHALAAGEYETAAAALTESTLRKDLQRRGRVLEVWDLCRPLLDVAGQLTLLTRFRVHRLAAGCLEELGDYAAADAMLGRCRAEVDAVRGTHDEYRLLHRRCSLLRKMQRYEAAEEAGRQALELVRRLNRREDEAWTLGELAALERNRGRPGVSARLAAEALALADQTEDRLLRAQARCNVARVHVGGGGLGRAKKLYEEALELVREAGNVGDQARILEALADIARRQTRNQKAVEQVHEAIAIFQRIGDRTGEGIARHCLGLTLHQMGRQYAEAAAGELRQSLRWAFDLNHPREVAGVLCSLARLFPEGNGVAVAAACYQTATDLHARMGHQQWKKGRRYLEALRQSAEQAGVNWQDVESQVRAERYSLLERASGIDAGRWKAFAADATAGGGVVETAPL